MREELLQIKGVGPETADSIMTYAVMKPFFVIDTYTRRLLERMGIKCPKKYDELRALIERGVPKDLYIYNEFHGLIVKHAKVHCMKKPNCIDCPVSLICEYKV